MTHPNQDGVLVRQRWNDYAPEQHRVWQTLFDKRVRQLEELVVPEYLQGLATLNLAGDAVPDLARLNERLIAATGWEVIGVTGFLPPRTFFRCLADRRFPSTLTIRAADRLDYVPEPDIFHDVFGHVPLLAIPSYAEYVHRFGQLAAACSDDELERYARIFWFTIEFGLAGNLSDPKVYGSGLISSEADCRNALGRSCTRLPFDPAKVVAQSFSVDCIQEVLFVVPSLASLPRVLEC